MVRPIRVGVQTWPEHAEYADLRAAWVAAEGLGVDTLWLWDHFFPLNGDPDGRSLECWSLLAAMAEVTTRVEFGALVSCTAYRNPNLIADLARTVDHIAGGRLILGLGAGWFRRDFEEYGYPFGAAVPRLRAFARAVPAIQDRLGRLNPPPVRGTIPLLIGGTGEKLTLQLVARHAQIWNAIADEPGELRRKGAILDGWCAAIGRAPTAIERSLALYEPAQLERLEEYRAAGFTHFVYGVGGPAFDLDPIRHLLAWRDVCNSIG